MPRNKQRRQLDRIENQLREIFNHVSQPTEQLNLMQLRVAAYKKINSAVEHIDRLLEFIETEYITEVEDISQSPSLIFLNRQQEDEHNQELHDITDKLREIRWLLVSPPENYQNESPTTKVTGT